MKVLHRIKEIREVALKHFDDLKNEKEKEIVFMTRELSSRSINGGLGDEDTDVFIGLNSEGWIKRIETVEFGQYANGTQFNNLLECDIYKITDEAVENYINSEECTIREFVRFMKKYDEIREKYPNELNEFYSIFDN